jgi:hypothetical protein
LEKYSQLSPHTGQLGEAVMAKGLVSSGVKLVNGNDITDTKGYKKHVK